MNIKNEQFQLISPPASQTQSSIALVWDKPKLDFSISLYQVFVNGNLYDVTQKTDYTLTKLESDTEYEITIYAKLENKESLISNIIRVKTKLESEKFDITNFGAIGDGIRLNTENIQKAIDNCSEGGTVYVPKGVFVTGAIFLKSNMTLYIEDGGVLLGSTNLEDYPILSYRFEGLETLCYASLINTSFEIKGRMENITISGRGKIDANGSILRKKELKDNKGKPGRAVCLRNVDYLYLNDITIKHSPAWCVHFIYCNNVSINNIKIYVKHDENGTRYEDICNGDGLDPDSSSNVYIFNSMIASQDDCIAIKSGKDDEGRTVGIPSENIRITNCVFKSGFGVAIGSEMSGDVRNVLVQDCIFDNVYSICSIKTPRGRGGIIENISYEDITLTHYNSELCDCEWFRGAIYIDQFYSHVTFDVNKKEEINDGTSVIRDIYFKNITLNTSTGNAVYLTGLPEKPLENIYLENIKAIGKYGFKANNIDGLFLNNVSVNSKEDKDFIFNNVRKKN